MRTVFLVTLALACGNNRVPSTTSSSSAASHAGGDGDGRANVLPSFVVSGSLTKQTYDGVSNDLLTGGLGKSGLAGAPPKFADAAHPTAAELRTLAIYTNYRALVDMAPGGGYGTLWGPNVDVNGNDTLGEGKVAGDEWIAYEDDGTGAKNVTMMVQIPASFDPALACIVTATSSGSRGVYGAIATAGEWGLKHGCAVAYSDKGTGTAVHDLTNDTVELIDGTRDTATNAGTRSQFTAALTAAERAALTNRLAIKHAHSQQNPEADWGKNTLHAVQFAFYAINEKFGRVTGNGVRQASIDQHNTITIAASVSNGGGAALAAAEQDEEGLITGVVAGEPQVYVGEGVRVFRGGVQQPATGKSLEDYITIANLYQPCAALSAAAISDVFGNTAPALATNRCAALKAKGLLTATTTSAQADEALRKLHDAGWQAESDILHNSHFGLYATTAVAVAYANAYARASVKDNLCGYSYAFVGANHGPTAPNPLQLASMFGLENGVPPSNGIVLIANGAANGPIQDQFALSASTGAADYNVDGAACLRALATDNATVAASVAAVRRTGDLHNKPTILVQGRSDALVPVNHASRAYLGLAPRGGGDDGEDVGEDGGRGGVTYYEIEHGQHFDAFLPLPGFANHFVPVHRYVVQALDAMYAHLRTGAPIPPSQVVRTTPRGKSSISTANVPPIAATPAAGDAIVATRGFVFVPN